MVEKITKKLTPEERKAIIDKIALLKKEEEILRRTIEDIRKEFTTLPSQSTVSSIKERIQENISWQKLSTLRWPTKEKTQENIKKELENNPKYREKIEEFFQKNGKKIKKWVIIIAITGAILGMIRWTAEIIKNENIKKEIKKAQTEQIDEWIQDIPVNPDIIDVKELQENIASSDLDGVTYEQVTKAVMSIKNQEVRRNIIVFFRCNNTIGIQEYLGMKESSEYSSNKITGKIDKNTLDRLSDPMFWLSWNDILNHPNIPQEVKEIYKDFANGKINTNKQNYIIVCKNNTTVYLFNTAHQLINHQIVLIWAKTGNSQFKIRKNPTTPAGFYRIEGNKRTTDAIGTVRYIPTTKKDGKIQAEDGTGYLLDLLPIDIQTGKYNNAYDVTKWGLALHPTPKKLLEERITYFETPTTADNLCTWWCVDLSEYSIIHDNTAAGTNGTIVYITSE